MDYDCVICRTPYNSINIPMLICTDQHLCCNSCVDRLLSSVNTCPICRQMINKNIVAKFRYFNIFQEEIKKNKEEFEGKLREKIGQLDIYKQLIKELILFDRNKDAKLLYQYIKQKAEKLVEAQNFELASTLLQALIEKYPNLSEGPFVGLGSKEQQKGFSQAQDLGWYKNRYGITNIAAEDLLAYIFLVKPNYTEHKRWYEQMIKSNPQNYKFIYGLALTQQNYGSIFYAPQLYERVIKLNESFNKPYCMLALLQLKFTPEYILKHLQKQESNIFADYILAIREKQQRRLEKLDKIIQKEPTYVRAIKQIGDYLLEKHKYEEALEKYKACKSINTHYAEPYVKLGICQFELNRQADAIQTLTAVAERQMQLELKGQCYFYLGVSYKKIKQYEKSFIFLKKYAGIKPTCQKGSFQLGEVCFELSKYEESIKIFKSLLTKNSKLDKAAIYEKICSCYDKMKQLFDSIEWLAKWLEIDPNNISIHESLAQKYFEIKCWGQALKWSEKCVQKNYREYYFNCRITEILENQNKQEIALKKILAVIGSPRINTKERGDLLFKACQLNIKIDEKQKLEKKQTQ